MTRTSFTVDVHLHRDFWSPAARAAAVEARKRKASASAGRAAASAAYGREDGTKRLKAAAQAHGKVHGDDHAAVFAKAAAAHTQRIASRRKLATGAAKRTTKIGRKVGAGLIRSMMRAHEEAKIQ